MTLAWVREVMDGERLEPSFAGLGDGMLWLFLIWDAEWATWDDPPGEALPDVSVPLTGGLMRDGGAMGRCIGEEGRPITIENEEFVELPPGKEPCTEWEWGERNCCEDGVDNSESGWVGLFSSY